MERRGGQVHESERGRSPALCDGISKSGCISQETMYAVCPAGCGTTLDTAIVARRMILVLCAVVHTLSHRGTRSNVRRCNSSGVASAVTLPFSRVATHPFFSLPSTCGQQNGHPMVLPACVGGNLMDPRSAGPCYRLRIDSSCSRGQCVFLRFVRTPTTGKLIKSCRFTASVHRGRRPLSCLLHPLHPL